jgi:dTDP-4-amino-4,6-dideoxygalactose transaminase
MIEVTKTYLPHPDKYYKNIENCFKTSIVSNGGLNVQLLEERLADYLNVKNIILVANGTLGLLVAYKALELRNEIITTPFSFNATAGSIYWGGLSPVFADIDKSTFNISVDEIKKNININTSAIVPVHAFGNACNVEEIEKIARDNNLKLIYDAAQAFGVNFKNQSILEYGDISVLSFHATKLFHTIEGGAIITKDAKMAKKIRSMINFGFSSPFMSTYNGINAKMSEFHAAMGLAVLDDIDYITKQRKKIWNSYFNNINAPVRVQKLNSNSNYNYHYYPIVFKTKNEVLNAEKLLQLKGIKARRYFYPSLDSLDYFQITSKKKCHNSIEISSKILCLPIFPTLDESAQSLIIETINSIYE